MNRSFLFVLSIILFISALTVANRVYVAANHVAAAVTSQFDIDKR